MRDGTQGVRARRPLVASRINFRCLSTNDAPRGIVMAARGLLCLRSFRLSLVEGRREISGMVDDTGVFFNPSVRHW